MSFSFSTDAREVLEQVVRQPGFRKITTIPLVAPVTNSLIFGAYTGFALSSYFWLQGSLPLVLMLAINGFFVYVAFSPLHDATHRTLSCDRRLNDFLGTVACFALLPGITTRIYRYLHLEHHRYAGDPLRDPDEIFVSAPRWGLPFVIAFPDVVWTQWYLRHWNERPPSERIEFALGIAFYISWHAAWLASPYAMQFFLLWMIPQRIGVTLVIFFFAHIQHPAGMHWEQAPFQTTVLIRCHPVLRYLMLSQTEHCLHHLMPSVPLYRYHEAWEAGRHLFEQQNIPVRGFFSPVSTLTLPHLAKNTCLSVTVTRVDDVADGVRSYELRSLKGEALPPFTAGAHIDLIISDRITRQYSLLNAPSERDRYVIAVKREDAGRGGSQLAHQSLQQGKSVAISRPRNNFPLVLATRRYVLVSGGIGITPLLAMAHALHESAQPFEFHICARSSALLPFATTLGDLPFAECITVHLDDGADEQRLTPNRDLGGWQSGGALYICGPAAFMSWIDEEARSLNWPGTAIYSESFTPRRGSEPNEPFEVELARTGKVLQVRADEFLIDVLHRNKCGIPISCTQGICGSCITPVLGGTPEHRDAILSDEERTRGNVMCVCVGRAKPGTGRLILDA